jgi:predicted dehydrogenase
MIGKTLGLGIAGVGGWGTNVLRSCLRTSRARVVALCDTNRETLARHRKMTGGAIKDSGFGEMLADPQVEAIVLATPTPTHASMAQEALRAGKHVFVEKPIASSTREATALVQWSRRRKRVLMVGHLLKYHPAVEWLKAAIDAGELGEIRYLYSQRLNLGVIRKEENALWSLAPHDLSIALHLMGKAPDAVSAHGECYVQKRVEDVVFVNLHFRNKKMAQIHVSWLDPSKTRRMVVVGSKKMAVFDDMQVAEKIKVYDKRAAPSSPKATDSRKAVSVRHGEIYIPVIPDEEPLDREIRHFTDCVIDRVPCRSGGEDGLQVVRLLEAAARSLQKGGVPTRLHPRG